MTTEVIFGDNLHKYTLAHGIPDGNVLGFDLYKEETFKEQEVREAVALHMTAGEGEPAPDSVDEIANDKAKAEKLFSELGLTMNAAFNMFAKQSIREQGIPFKITRNTNVQYMDRSLLDRMLEESEKKHHKVYEELAK